MPKKIQCLCFTLFILMTFLGTSIAMPPWGAPGVARNTALSINDAEPGGIIDQVTSNSTEDEKKAMKKEYEELQKELDALIKEMKRLEKVFKKKFEKDILPQLKKEIERLREWLKEFHPQDDIPEPRPAEKRNI